MRQKKFATATVRSLDIVALPKGFKAEGAVTRHAVRAIAYVGGTLLMVRSEKTGDWKFPGGGVEAGETPEAALEREMIEETGHALTALSGPYLTVRERRPAGKNPKDLLDMRSDYYLAEVAPERGELNLDDYEKDLGFEPRFVTPGLALAENRAIERAGSAIPIPWLKREIRVLRLLPSKGTPGLLSFPGSLSLYSERLALVPLSPAHRESVFRAFTADIARYMYPKPAESIDETDAFIESSIREGNEGKTLQFAITERGTGAFIGCVGIHGLSETAPEIGVWVASDRQGKGYGLEAVRKAVLWAGSRMDVDGFRYPVDRRNTASRKIAEASGGFPLREFRSTGLGGNELDQIEYFIPAQSRPGRTFMPPAPALAPYGRWLETPETGRLFLYDTASPSLKAEKALQGIHPADTEARAGSAAKKARGTFILVHGLGDEADSWRALFPLLAERGYRVIAPDLPGFGRSIAPGTATMKVHARAVRAVMAHARNSAPVHLVGSSLGAAVCELAAFSLRESGRSGVRDPSLPASLAFLDGGLPTAEPFSAKILAVFVPGLAERGYRAYRNRGEAAYRSLMPYYSKLGNLGETDQAFLRERVMARVESETQLRAYYSSFRDYLRLALVSRGRFTRGLEKLANEGVRFLVLWGSEDRILSLKGSAPLRSVLGERVTRYAVLPGTGHLPHQEKPAAVADALLQLAETP